MPMTLLKSPEAAARWLESWVRGTLRTDSRRVQPGDAFIAWPGHATDGRRYVHDALAAGATTCVVERDGVEAFGFDDARVAALPGLKAAAGRIADTYFAHPSGELAMVATTGTNGKTSSAWWVAQALTALGQPCSVIGTLGVGHPPGPGRVRPEVRATGLTTPDPVMLHATLRTFADGGDRACAFEASSIGIVEARLEGVRIDVALFTNFTQDHLDFHGSMEAYWAAKRRLFAWPGLRAAVLNVDDPQGAALAAELVGTGIALWTVGVAMPARLHAVSVRHGADGLVFTVHEDDARAEVTSRLIGAYNVSNLLGVLGVLRALDVPLAEAAAVLSQLTPVPGRLQRVGDGHPEVVVDYAHTPDALDKVLLALRPLAQARGGRLWCVFGCGGDRDAGKRPLMAAIAARRADRVIVTSDNPRGEDPLAIIEQIATGLPRADAAERIADRRTAIERAIAAAAPADVVLLAGKGHEDYQEVAGVRHPFADADVASAALAARAAAGGAVA